jgi:hypothetical protein
VAADALHICKRALHQSQKSLMEKLWWQGNSVQIRFAKPYGTMASRQYELNQITTNRSNRQRRSLRSGEPSSCSGRGKWEQSARAKGYSKAAQVSDKASRDKIRRQHTVRAAKEHDIRRSDQKISPKVKQTKRRVWDILNAGPRNRFTCEGLLVSNCLVLDFGGNIARHGSIDDPNYGRASVSSGSGGSGVEKNGRGKECLNCGIDVPAGDKECPECGFRFPDEPKDRHDETSDDTSTLTGVPDPEEWVVVGVAWGIHTKRNAPPDTPRTLRVDYTCQPMYSDGGNLSQKVVSEWVCFEHGGFARIKAVKWWEARSTHDVPQTIDDAVSYLDRHVARVPASLTTQADGKFSRIVSVEFKDARPDESEWSQVVVDGDEYQYFHDDEVPF